MMKIANGKADILWGFELALQRNPGMSFMQVVAKVTEGHAATTDRQLRAALSSYTQADNARGQKVGPRYPRKGVAA